MLVNAVPRPLLLKQLRRMSHVIPSSSPKEVLTKIKLVFDGASICLQGTDIEKFLTVSMPCKCEEAGAALVSYGAFRDVVAKLTGEFIELSIEGDVVVVGDGVSRMELMSHSDINEFPSEPSFEASQVFRMDASEFSESLSSIAHCTDKDATRYALNALSLQCNSSNHAGIVEFMATDGRRCAIRSSQVTTDAEEASFTLLIPATAVKCIPSVIDGSKDEVAVHVSAEWVRAVGAGFDFCARQMEGRFPNVKAIMKDFNGTKLFDIDVLAVRSIAAQGCVVSDTESRGLDMTFGDGCVKFKHESPRVKFSASISCDHHEEKASIDSTYFQQAVLDCESIQIAVKDNKMLIVRDGNANEVIMGMAK